MTSVTQKHYDFARSRYLCHCALTHKLRTDALKNQRLTLRETP